MLYRHICLVIGTPACCSWDGGSPLGCRGSEFHRTGSGCRTCKTLLCFFTFQELFSPLLCSLMNICIQRDGLSVDMRAESSPLAHLGSLRQPDFSCRGVGCGGSFTVNSGNPTLLRPFTEDRHMPGKLNVPYVIIFPIVMFCYVFSSVCSLWSTATTIFMPKKCYTCPIEV